MPFDGQTELAIQPKSDRLVIIATEQMPVPIIERKILLQLSEELMAQAGKIEVSSSDARINATWKAAGDSKSRPSEIDLKIDVRDSGAFAGDRHNPHIGRGRCSGFPVLATGQEKDGTQGGDRSLSWRMS